MTTSLLPPGSTDAERALEAEVAKIGGAPVPIRTLWSADDCPEPLLPWLAWALSVDEWNPDWPEDIKRDVIRSSIEIHRRKGTIGSVRTAIRAFGFNQAQIIEDHVDDHWAEYRVILSRPISIAQSQLLRRILASVAPARCHLSLLDFVEASFLYDNTIAYDGTYSYGAT